MWYLKTENNIAYYTIPQWAEQGCEVILTTRQAGVSRPPFDSLNLGLHVNDDKDKVIKNREILRDSLGLDNLVFGEQVHGIHIEEVTADHGNKGFYDNTDAFPSTDGLITAEKGVSLVTMYADCLPIACFDRERQKIGMAHSGWKGTFQNIGGELAKAMTKAYGSKIEDLEFALGSGILSCCYEVDDPFYQRFDMAYHNQAEKWFKAMGNGKYHFDNAGAVTDLLVAAGVKRENIVQPPCCTMCRQDLFFSHRGSGGKTGRHGLICRLL